MKKIRLFTLLTLLVTLSLLLLVGCKKEDAISSIALKDHDPNIAIEIAVGEFDYGAYTLVATYKSGNAEEIALSKDMIADTDLVKLYQEGEHDITVMYGDQKCTFKVSVKRSTFKDLSFSENNVFSYNGKAHVVEVEGNIPANAVINYVGGNSFVNVGTYDVTAIISCEGYVTERLSTTVKIEKAKYDLSGVKFEAKEFVYDGQSHSVSISGTLPEGVSSPTYFIGDKETSSAVDAGEYKVIARFANNDPNYETIPDMETTLKILPAVYTVKGVSVVFKTEDGKPIDGNTKIYDGKNVIFDLNDDSKLSKKISVLFSVLDKDGNVLSTSNKTTGIKEVGVYTVKVDFTLVDGKNYEPIAPLIATFEVLKAEHPSLAGVSFVSKQTTYNDNPQSIVIEGQLPEGVNVSYEYYLGSTLIVDNDGKPVQAVTDVGIYTVKAVFTHTDANYGKIADLSATLNIKKAEVSLALVGFAGESSVEYSGSPYQPSFTTWKEINKTDYDLLEYTAVKYYVLNVASGKYVEMDENVYPTEVGTYRAVIEVSVADDYKNNYTLSNGNEVYTITKQFEIIKIELENPIVTFTTTTSEWEYTENAQEITYTSSNCDSNFVTVSTAYYKYTASGYVAISSVPKDVGSYKFVVTVSIKDVKLTHYIFASGETSKDFSFEFEIFQKTIDVSGVNCDADEFTYNGSEQQPDLTGVPDYVNATLKLYYSGEMTPIESAVNAGNYRIEVEFAPVNSNYKLSSNGKLTFNFKISPLEIDVSNLEFDSFTFEYDEKAHKPELVEIPDHVQITYNLFLINTLSNEETYVDEAIDAGKYRYKLWLSEENSNYALIGQKSYVIDFEIKPNRIVIADIDALLHQSDFCIELPYGDGEYKYEEDDDVHKKAILAAVFGDNSSLVKIENIGSPTDVVTGKPLSNLLGDITIKDDRIYTIKCQVVVNVPDQHVFFYDNKYLTTAEITFNVKFVNNNV